MGAGLRGRRRGLEKKRADSCKWVFLPQIEPQRSSLREAVPRRTSKGLPSVLLGREGGREEEKRGAGAKVQAGSPFLALTVQAWHLGEE